MPVYKCPVCGRMVTLERGRYYCKYCGPTAVMFEAYWYGESSSESPSESPKKIELRTDSMLLLHVKADKKEKFFQVWTHGEGGLKKISKKEYEELLRRIT